MKLPGRFSTYSLVEPHIQNALSLLAGRPHPVALRLGSKLSLKIGLIELATHLNGAPYLSPN
jgi:hypothetical protein